jgi:hypothetical protein
MPLVSLMVGVAVGAAALLLWPGGEPSPSAEVESPELAASSAAKGGARAPRIAATALPPAREDRAPSLVGLPSEAFASDVAVVPRPVPTPRLADPPASELALAAGAQEQPAALSGPGDAVDPSTGARAASAPPPGAAPTLPLDEPPRRSLAADSSDPPAEPSLAPPPRSLARVEPEPSGAALAPERRSADSVDERSADPTVAPTPVGAEDFAPEFSARPSATEPSQIRVEKTLWHPEAGRRVAVVSLPDHDGPLRVREGEVVGEVLVSKIEPSGVVFSGNRGEVRRAVGAP